MVIRRPFPGLTPTIWNDPQRYAADYWGRIPGVYYSGDAAHIDDDGYVWFAGRADEIIKIAGHRIGTIEVETAFLRHPAVAEAGVTGRADELRGEGRLLDSQMLESASTAKSLRSRKNRLTIVDGPYAESKEVLAGFNLIEAEDMDEAVRIAAEFPWARTGCVEVRPVRDIGAVRQQVGAA